MKHRYQPLSLAVRLVLALLPAPALAAELIVSVEDIRTSSGKLMIAILDSEAAFNGEQPAVASLLLPANGDAVSFSIDALPSGRYGVRVMHDVNDNDDLDSNLVGMPTEPWGFSNDAKGNFGPPVWADVSFELADTSRQTIQLNH
jgi:uncharacterized protein (DUF2141 family)